MQQIKVAILVVVVAILIFALVRRDPFESGDEMEMAAAAKDPRNTINVPYGVVYVPWARNPNIYLSRYTVPAAHFPAESGTTGAWQEINSEIRGGYDPDKDVHYINGLNPGSK